MIVKLLIEHHLEFVSLKGGCRGSSESTHVKMPHCWKSHALAHISRTCTKYTHCPRYHDAITIDLIRPLTDFRYFYQGCP